jgi:hypothetical protein
MNTPFFGAGAALIMENYFFPLALFCYVCLYKCTIYCHE